MIRIGIDARALQRVPRGIPLYLRRLCEHLPAVMPDARFILFVNHSFPHNLPRAEYAPVLDSLISTGRFEVVNGDHTVEEYWEQWILRGLVASSRPDVLFMPANRVPLFVTVPVVAAVHDVMERKFLKDVIKMPDDVGVRMRLYQWRQRGYIRLMYSAGVRRAAHIVTPTEQSKRDLVDYLGLPPERVTAIHHGRDEAFAPARPVPRAARRYTLMLGGDSFQKNADGAIHAWARVSPTIRRQYPLRVVGFAGTADSILLRTIRSHNLQHEVTVERWLSDDALVARFQGAAVFLFLSLYEGFGFPILHAMTAGTPVVYSNASSLPEVAGAAGIPCSPTNPPQIAVALERVLTDEAEWDRCQSGGFEQARRFDWTLSAVEHARVFREFGSR